MGNFARHDICGGRRMTTWTDEQIEHLRQRHADGLSFSEIACELPGFSRNAVIGKAQRLGLAARVTISQRRPAPAKRVRGRASKITPQPAPEPKPPEPVRLFDLEPHHCRWPVSGEGADTLFCGASKRSGSSSYCRKHFAWSCRDCSSAEKTLGRADVNAHQGARS
jgi:GcrA cell cycle regulator